LAFRWPSVAPRPYRVDFPSPPSWTAARVGLRPAQTLAPTHRRPGANAAPAPRPRDPARMVNRNLLRQFDLPETELQQELAAAFNQDVYQEDDNGTWLPPSEQEFEVNKIVNGRVLNVIGDEVWVDVGYK